MPSPDYLLLMIYMTCEHKSRNSVSLLLVYIYMQVEQEIYKKRGVILEALAVYLKGFRMSRSDKVSLWYVALLINTRFRFFILE